MPMSPGSLCATPSVLWNTTCVHAVPDYARFADDLLRQFRESPVVGNNALDVRALSCVPEDSGLWLEFGVWRGSTIRHIADYRAHHRDQPATPIFGFDAFRGLPEKWRDDNTNAARGSFSMGGAPPTLSARHQELIEFVPGWFNESLPPFLHRQRKPVSFLHIDCDLYSSTLTVLQLLTASNRLRPGSLVVFDEIFGYRDFRQHEMRALWEWLRQTPHLSAQVVGSSTNSILDHPTAQTENAAKQAAVVRLVHTSQCAHPE